MGHNAVARAAPIMRLPNFHIRNASSATSWSRGVCQWEHLENHLVSLTCDEEVGKERIRQERGYPLPCHWREDVLLGNSRLGVKVYTANPSHLGYRRCMSVANMQRTWRICLPAAETHNMMGKMIINHDCHRT